ncbi:MAG: Fic family protein [Pseudomonadales bacterium]
MPASNRPSRSINPPPLPPLDTRSTQVGYASLITTHQLAVMPPDHPCAIGAKHKRYDNGRWRLFTPRHKPEDSLQGHLTFALKYEGIDLALLHALFKSVPQDEITTLVKSKPTSAYSRRIWFLYEWLCEQELDIPDATKGNFIPLLNATLQYPGPAQDSKRHRVRNNLPGTRQFCPLIRRTDKLDKFMAMNLAQAALDSISATNAHLISRAAAFLLLKDSKASHTIEGEAPPRSKIESWGRIIGEAGQRPLSLEELERIQRIVIADYHFTMPGIRYGGGFVGDHDRITGHPVPAHISARPEDLASLLEGLLATDSRLADSDYDAVLAAALVSFGFVFMHPFEDGNGRIHRYLIHHVLAEQGFVPAGLTFPVSAVILDRLDAYRKTLEHYSKPRLGLIEWRPTDKNNVEVLNETIDLYRYFDATRQAEFLFECVAETVNKTLPEEVDYLAKYDLLNDFIKNYINMPDKQMDLLIRFLNQNRGKLSQRARKKEFAALTEPEVQAIESRYDQVFQPDP